MKLWPLLAFLAFTGCSVQQNSVLNSFGTAEGFNCSHVSTRDAEATTITTLCRDELNGGKVVLANASVVPNAAWSDLLSAVTEVGMGVITPILAGLAL
jgi:hypothetical protein